VVSEILKIQRQDFANGLTENCGASIDVIYLVHKLASHKRYTNNVKASSIATDCVIFDSENNEALKFAKPLTKRAQNSAYAMVRKAVTA
jgi:hypothetical protein